MRAKPDWLTLAALGVLAFTLNAVVHELVGHGGAAVLMGCVPEGVSSAWWNGDCSKLENATTAVRAVKVGGTVANLVTAAIAMAVFLPLRSRPSPDTGTFFVWLVFVTNLLSGAGYMMVDPLFGFGDWTAFIATYDSPILRWIVVGAGVALSLAGLLLGRRWLLPWLGNDAVEARRRSRTLCLIPYVAGASVVPLSALLNPLGPVFALTSALSTFGGCAWLVWIGLDPLRPSTTPTNGSVTRSMLWIGAGAVTLVTLFAVLGPGIAFGP